MTNDVRELKETLLFEIQKKGKDSNPCNNSIQNAKDELADVENKVKKNSLLKKF